MLAALTVLVLILLAGCLSAAWWTVHTLLPCLATLTRQMDELAQMPATPSTGSSMRL
jgi:hypothetical protein